MAGVHAHTGMYENLARRVREEREKKCSKERARNPQERHSRQGQKEKSSTGTGTAGWGLNSTDRTRSRAEDTCYVPLSPWRAGHTRRRAEKWSGWQCQRTVQANQQSRHGVHWGTRLASGQVSQCSRSSGFEQAKTGAGAGVAQAGH